MAVYSVQKHHVFNELDSQGLLLNLPRLTGEDNPSYKRRLMDVYVHRANSTYRGLLNGITRELGLSFTRELKIVPNLSEVASPNKAVVFKDYECCVYSDYYTETIAAKFDRQLMSGGAYTLNELVHSINSVKVGNVQLFTATFIGKESANKALTVFEQSSIIQEFSESLESRGVIISLRRNNLIEGAEYILSGTLTNKVSTLQEVVDKGDYFIDYSEGKLHCAAAPGANSYIRYTYRNDEFFVEATPVIITGLQSETIKRKMFEQVFQEDGTYENGRPTNFGADIINELLSVFPTTYKT